MFARHGILNEIDSKEKMICLADPCPEGVPAKARKFGTTFPLFKGLTPATLWPITPSAGLRDMRMLNALLRLR